MRFEKKQEIAPQSISPLVLAYVGDAVYELYVRTYLVRMFPKKVNQLHQEAVSYVNSLAQAKLLQHLEDILTEDEMRIVKRGRNAKSKHTPKNAQVLNYRHSTALESLVGFLYLSGKWERLDQIFQVLWDMVEQEQ
ncbi:MAG: Mini-ribonuclease 3 [Bacillota bacterium]